MYRLQETKGDCGFYHECTNDECRRLEAEEGNSRSPGWFATEEHTRCRICQTMHIRRMECIRPREIRLIRGGDGLVVARWPLSARRRAEKKCERLNNRVVSKTLKGLML